MSVRKKTFVGIDSDGCVFDSINVKERDFFFPRIISHWHLEPVADALIDCAAFVGIHSRRRGLNRFIILYYTLALLETHPATQGKDYPRPALDALGRYIHSNVAFGMKSLEAAYDATHDPELRRALDWSRDVSHAIATQMTPIPPFANALRGLATIHATSDAAVISQTPQADLIREWDLHAIRSFVNAIAGQEDGSKADQLRHATAGCYTPKAMLMIGDAPGDWIAAQEAGVLFYPIIPGDEERAWQRFIEEAYPKFLAGTYAGAYAQTLTTAFLDALPETPPWQGANA